LIVNAIEAMSPHAAGARDLLIRTVRTRSGITRPSKTIRELNCSSAITKG
jgi:hypothetical protein